MSFKDLGLNEKTIRAIEDLGYQEPTTVQKDVIPSILAGKDIFTIAPAACGKTCSYIFPLIDVISRKEGQNILILTADEKESVNISDKFSVFNRYHEEEDTAEKENTDSEANVIIASPDLLLENIAEERVDVSNVGILVVDDINLIKKKHQLANLNKILELLPAEKQNIIFTTRRSKETQDTLNKILKAPAEIKVDRNRESEVNKVRRNSAETPASTQKNVQPETSCKRAAKNAKMSAKPPLWDEEAVELAKKYKIFGTNAPSFLLAATQLAASAE